MVGFTIGRQLLALIRKNLLLSVIRRPFGFLLLVYGFPTAILVVLLSIPSFLTTSNGLGTSSAVPIRELVDVLNKPLIIVRPPDLGNDVDRVIQSFISPLDRKLVNIINRESDLVDLCLANSQGVSRCFASVTFLDSPETKVTIKDSPTGSNHTWKYTVRADPSKTSGKFSIPKHDTVSENLHLPLQLAVNNAITKRQDRPRTFGFTSETAEKQKRENLQNGLGLMGQIYLFALFVSFYMIIYRFTSFITSDRDTGMSQLIDSMGGRWSPLSRVLAWLAAMNIVSIPCFIIFGVIYWTLAFPTTNVGLLIGWQVLQGLSVNSSTVFAAAWFKKSRVSSIYVIGGFLVLSVGAQIYGLQVIPERPASEGVYPLIALFSSANYVYFAQQMVLWETQGLPADIQNLPKPDLGLNSESYGITQSKMLAFLSFQIIVYPLLAILVEYLVHGISFSHRVFESETDQLPNENSLVVEISNLKKDFAPGFWSTTFCCGKKTTVRAVNGISLAGQRGQILCLVGPNGSGKTTTLHMVAGFTKPSSGKIMVGASPSQIGICPQRNIIWDYLTVREHVKIWSQIKGGKESLPEIEELIRSCDLQAKINCQAKTLSGGQKRKLQLACMFVGNSTICLIDECTSGLDPLSRRIIWEILLEQRAKRSIVFTTHFLDEVEVLADHIAILSKGKVKCYGAAAELKAQFANGYKVIVPISAEDIDVPYTGKVHQDRLVYAVPDSASAAQLSSRLSAAGMSSVAITGPQVEDVFLNVLEDVDLKPENGEVRAHIDKQFKMSATKATSFKSQVWTIFRKRLNVLLRFWWPYFYVLALPIIIVPNMKGLLKAYKPDFCKNSTPQLSQAQFYSDFYAEQSCSGSYCRKTYIGAGALDRALHTLVNKGFFDVSAVNPKYYGSIFRTETSLRAWTEAIMNATGDYYNRGGLFYDSSSDPGTIAWVFQEGFPPSGWQLLNLYSQLKSGIEILAATDVFAETRKPSLNNGIVYAIFFSLVIAVYPAAFVLYPAIEKSRRVRSVAYANGVRRAPLWVAYGLFDFAFVLLISLVLTTLMSIQIAWVGTVWVMLPVLMLHGLAAILLGYIICHFVNGALESFLAVFGVNVVMYAIAAITFGVGWTSASGKHAERIADGLTYGLHLIFPIGNVLRAVLLGFNVNLIRCRDGHLLRTGSFYAFGAPIFYLFLQSAILLFLLIWIEGDIALFRRKSPVATSGDREKCIGDSSVNSDVDAERQRVEGTDADLLRVLHLSKDFGSNQALDDITLGVLPGEVLALIGPNGAGKSTLVNLVQSDHYSHRGQAYICGEDSRSVSAQRFLGVCPQYDAMDMMNTRDHLWFYARIKGIDHPRANIDHIMASLGLKPHANTEATKLSGGNKRKLSLAIALIGTPPVLILDEPTSAMDAVAKRSFWKIIQSISSNHCILLTTHSMEEADILANRAAIISKRLLAVGTSQYLRHRYSNVYHVSMILRSAPSSSPSDMEALQSFIVHHVHGAQLERDMMGGQVRFTVPGGDSSSRNIINVINLLEDNKQQLGVEYYSVTAATLENVFLRVVQANNVQEENTDGNARRWRGCFGKLL